MVLIRCEIENYERMKRGKTTTTTTTKDRNPSVLHAVKVGKCVTKTTGKSNHDDPNQYSRVQKIRDQERYEFKSIGIYRTVSAIAFNLKLH